jgi:hypothetical protein
MVIQFYTLYYLFYYLLILYKLLNYKITYNYSNKIDGYYLKYINTCEGIIHFTKSTNIPKIITFH